MTSFIVSMYIDHTNIDQDDPVHFIFENLDTLDINTKPIYGTYDTYPNFSSLDKTQMKEIFEKVIDMNNWKRNQRIIAEPNVIGWNHIRYEPNL